MKQAKVAILFILTSILSNDSGACGTNKQISKIMYKFDHVQTRNMQSSWNLLALYL